MRNLMLRLREKIVSAVDPGPGYVRQAYNGDLKNNVEKVLRAQSLDLKMSYSWEARYFQ